MKSKPVIYLVVCGAILILSARADARIIYVDAGGGGDYTKIQDGIDAAGSGDEIHILPGVYSPETNEEKFPINIGYKGFITVKAEVPGVLIQYNGSEYLWAIFYAYGNTGVLIEGLEIYQASEYGGGIATGFPSGPYDGGVYIFNNYIRGGGISTRRSVTAVVKNNILERSAIFFEDHRHVIASGNMISNSRSFGIVLIRIHRSALISNNLITDCNYDGIFLGGEIPSVRIAFSTVTSCGDSGIYLASHASIINCIATGCQSGVESHGGIVPEVAYCNVWGNNGNYYGFPDPTGQKGNISEDPKFAPGPLGDYYLDQEESPCVDAGDPSFLPEKWETTSPDHRFDSWPVDMGYHYPAGLIPSSDTGPDGKGEVEN